MKFSVWHFPHLRNTQERLIEKCGCKARITKKQRQKDNLQIKMLPDLSVEGGGSSDVWQSAHQQKLLRMSSCVSQVLVISN